MPITHIKLAVTCQVCYKVFTFYPDLLYDKEFPQDAIDFIHKHEACDSTDSALRFASARSTRATALYKAAKKQTTRTHYSRKVLK